MRIHLLFRENLFSLKEKDPWGAEQLIRDLDLEPILDTMGNGDNFIKEVSRKVLLMGVANIEDIAYRQEALKDAIGNSETIRIAYQVLNDTIDSAERMWWLSRSNSSPVSTLSYSVKLLKIYITGLERIRDVLLPRKSGFKSRAFTSLINTLEQYFNKEYTKSLKTALKHLSPHEGMTLRMGLTRSAELWGFKLVKPSQKSTTGLKRIIDKISVRKYTWKLPPRDEAGEDELWNIKNLALEKPAKILNIAYQHVIEFINSLRTELAFYVGALNLWDRLKRIGAPTSFPIPRETGERVLRFKDLVEVSLALRIGRRPVPNTLDSKQRMIIVVSGPNKGGKTVFLRSIGQAQLMMMAGMYVAAEHYESSISTGVYTHFETEEKPNLGKGRLEEELARISEIVDHLKRGSMLLMNESFSSTNEKEGSEIAREILCALSDSGVRIIYVTHFYELQRWFLENRRYDTIFLKAERKEDGTRTYRIIPGEPEKRGYTEELYRRIFGEFS
ncbi:MAG: hypothetical protein F7B19_04470 [Desulfurococcales archaeon]|nr:hypothetical protein [Desulfurococcales archaeon]MCE4627510.1 hypothetical protein [Desulfurococcales archaeon]